LITPGDLVDTPRGRGEVLRVGNCKFFVRLENGANLWIDACDVTGVEI